MLPSKGSLTRDEQQWQHQEASSWAPVGWFTLVVLATALAWSMCLPTVSADLAIAPKPGQVFHLEWFLVSTTLGFAIFYAARSSWVVAIPSVVLASAQVLGIADEAAHRLQQAGVVSAETDLLYLMAVLQVVVFVSAGTAGLRHCLARRRWAKLNDRLAALDASTPQPHGPGQHR
jgi:hypothetical protein